MEEKKELLENVSEVTVEEMTENTDEIIEESGSGSTLLTLAGGVAVTAITVVFAKKAYKSAKKWLNDRKSKKDNPDDFMEDSFYDDEFEDNDEPSN